MNDWAFDLEDALLAGFHEDLLMLSHIPGVMAVVNWKLREIQRNPKRAGAVFAIGGDVVYVAKTGRYPSGTPSLLIVYKLDERRRLIRQVALCKAEEKDFERRIRRALRRRPKEH